MNLANIFLHIKPFNFLNHLNYFIFYLECPRNLSLIYQDSMIIVGGFGKPDLFVTVTCNPQWPEILSELKEVDNSQKLTIIARVFKLKLQAIFDKIFKKHIFWSCLSPYVCCRILKERTSTRSHFDNSRRRLQAQ